MQAMEVQPTEEEAVSEPGAELPRRAARRRATERALRTAAIDLITERGYDATSTSDIAAVAGVTQRTFFNYFPTKEAVVLPPADFLADVATAALRSRPIGEDVPASLAAAAMRTTRTFAASVLDDAGEPDGRRELSLAVVRLVFGEPAVRKLFLERRAAVEEAVWETLIERGASPDDLEARSAVSTVVALTYLALRIWAEGGGVEPLPAVCARCLLTAPDPARFAAGVTATDT